MSTRELFCSESDDSLLILPGLRLPLSEVELSAIRAQGSGGQNVNKVSSAIHLRFVVAVRDAAHLDIALRNLNRATVVLRAARSKVPMPG